VQFTNPCSAHTPHDSVTRFLSASRARNTRTAALLDDGLFFFGEHLDRFAADLDCL
jgi:hypothetical protein